MMIIAAMLWLTATAAGAVTISVGEGNRNADAGPFDLTTTFSGDNPPDLNVAQGSFMPPAIFSSGDVINTFGTVNGGQDPVIFNIDVPFVVSLVALGGSTARDVTIELALASTPSVLIDPIGGPGALDGINVSDGLSGPIFQVAAPGRYILTVDGLPGSGGVTHGLRISSVPLPGGLALMLGGLGLLAATRRSRRA